MWCAPSLCKLSYSIRKLLFIFFACYPVLFVLFKISTTFPKCCLCRYIGVFVSLHWCICVVTLVYLCRYIGVFMSLHWCVFVSLHWCICVVTLVYLCRYIGVFVSLHWCIYVVTLVYLCRYIGVFMSLHWCICVVTLVYLCSRARNQTLFAPNTKKNKIDLVWFHGKHDLISNRQVKQETRQCRRDFFAFGEHFLFGEEKEIYIEEVKNLGSKKFPGQTGYSAGVQKDIAPRFSCSSRKRFEQCQSIKKVTWSRIFFSKKKLYKKWNQIYIQRPDIIIFCPLPPLFFVPFFF